MKRRLVTLSLIAALMALPLAAACAKAPAPAPTPAPTATVTVTAPAPTAAATLTPTAAPSTQTYTLTMHWNEWRGDPTVMNRLHEPGGLFQRELYERSKGRLKLNIIARMFGSHAEAVVGVKEGKADMATIGVRNVYASFPVYGWLQVPGLITGKTHWDQYQQILAANLDPRMLELMDRFYRQDMNSVYLFQVGANPDVIFTTSKKITSAADFKGLKLEVSGAFEPELFKLLGASAVPLQASERTQAFMTGVVDAARSVIIYGYTSMGFDFAKYISMYPVTPSYAQNLVINAKVYDSLPADLQRVLKEVGRDMYYTSTAAIQGSLMYDEEYAKSRGAEVLQWTDEAKKEFQNIVREPLEKIYLKDAGARGAEVLAIVRDVIAKYDAFEAKPK